MLLKKIVIGTSTGSAGEGEASAEVRAFAEAMQAAEPRALFDSGVPELDAAQLMNAALLKAAALHVEGLARTARGQSGTESEQLAARVTLDTESAMLHRVDLVTGVWHPWGGAAGVVIELRVDGATTGKQYLGVQFEEESPESIT